MIPRTAPSLKARALGLLARREHSRHELAAKLTRHLQEGDDLQALLDALQASGLLSDERAAASVVHRRAPLLGTQSVAQELRRKGLSEALVRASTTALADTELQRARAVWHKRFGGEVATSPQERARQMRFLAARGFSGEVVRRVVRGRGGADDDQEL